MRDIRGDLQDRANLLKQQINAVQAQFENLIVQLKREEGSRVEDLKAEFKAVNRLIEVAAWHRNVRAAAVAAVAAAAAAEVSASAVAAACQPPAERKADSSS
jgi:hypothetical protein